MSNIQKLLSQLEDYIKKIDQRIRNEDLKNLDQAQRNLNDAKTLRDSCTKLVNISNHSLTTFKSNF
jgi:hypothetical protein